MELELKKKPNSRFAKGKSMYKLSIPIIESDVINFGIDKSLVGTTVDFTPQGYLKTLWYPG